MFAQRCNKKEDLHRIVVQDWSEIWKTSKGVWMTQQNFENGWLFLLIGSFIYLYQPSRNEGKAKVMFFSEDSLRNNRILPFIQIIASQLVFTLSRTEMSKTPNELEQLVYPKRSNYPQTLLPSFSPALLSSFLFFFFLLLSGFYLFIYVFLTPLSSTGKQVEEQHWTEMKARGARRSVWDVEGAPHTESASRFFVTLHLKRLKTAAFLPPVMCICWASEGSADRGAAWRGTSTSGE